MNQTKIIVVLGGWLVEDAGRWRTTTEDDAGDKWGPLYDRWRVLAAFYYWQQDPAQLIVASGGRGQLDSFLPSGLSVAKVITGELLELGVPPSNLLEETLGGTTYQQLSELDKLATTNNWQELLFISNNYHLPRIEAMLKQAPGLDKLRILKTTCLAAETILLNHDRVTWESKIQAAYQSEAMIKRQEAEAGGVINIKEGKYQWR